MMGPQVPIEVIEAARAGAPADIERLLGAVWPDAYRLAKEIVEEAQCAQDVAQEACIITYRSISSLRNAEAFRTWFYRIVVREALKQKRLTIATALLPTDAGRNEDHTDSLDLWRALATLPDPLRTVVVLRYFENLNSREIGAVLGVPDATVRFRLMRARRHLQPLLQEHDVLVSTKGEQLHAR